MRFGIRLTAAITGELNQLETYDSSGLAQDMNQFFPTSNDYVMREFAQCGRNRRARRQHCTDGTE